MAGTSGLKVTSFWNWATWLCIALLFLMAGSSFYFIRKGFEYHFMAVQMQTYSKLKWDEGKYPESANWFITSYRSAFDAGVRWSWARTFYLPAMVTFVQQGKLRDALESCERAKAFLGMVDDEGGIAYECVQIGDKLAEQRQHSNGWR